MIISKLQVVLRSINNWSLQVFGYKVQSRNDLLRNREKYLGLVEELQGCFEDEIFPDIPENQYRSKLIVDLIGTNPSEAMYIVNYLSKSLHLAGDVCEFGVAQGRTSTLIANEIRSSGKQLWLYDSFKGLPLPTGKDTLIDDIFNLGSIDKYAGTMNYPQTRVEAELNTIDFPKERYKILEGFVDGVIDNERMPNKVCFAYVDFDFFKPVLDVLCSLNNCVVSGGYILVDDYEFFSSGVKRAVDEFILKNKENYELILPKKFAGHFCILKRITD